MHDGATREKILEAAIEEGATVLDVAERFAVSPWALRRWFIEAFGSDELPPLHAPGDAARLPPDDSVLPELSTGLLVVGRCLRDEGEPVITRRLVERLHHLSQEVSRRTGEAMICVPWRWDSSSSPADLGDNDVVIGRLVARCAEGAYIGGELDDESGEWRDYPLVTETDSYDYGGCPWTTSRGLCLSQLRELLAAPREASSAAFWGEVQRIAAENGAAAARLDPASALFATVTGPVNAEGMVVFGEEVDARALAEGGVAVDHDWHHFVMQRDQECSESGLGGVVVASLQCGEDDLVVLDVSEAAEAALRRALDGYPWLSKTAGSAELLMIVGYDS